MAVTGGGTPYVEATDLVANYPATSLSLANKVDTKVDYALPVNAQTGTTYTFVLADGLRLTTASNAASSTYTVPPQSSVVWLANSVIRLVNYGAGVVTVAGGSGVTVTNAAKTLAQFESVALIRTGSDAWTLVPFSGGVSNADFSDAATGTYTDGGFNYKYITYTASGTLTVTTAGFADVLVVGGAGSGGKSIGGGGGAGGHLYATEVYLSAIAHTVTVGAGGATQTAAGVNSGNASAIGPFVAPMGGGGGGSNGLGANGGSGGAGSGLGFAPQGNNAGAALAGGSGVARNGGGGGAGAAGATGTASGNGGAGLANSITGTSVTRAGGGGAGSFNGTAGTGGAGGGGNGTTNNTAGSAGSVNTGGGGGGGGYPGSGAGGDGGAGGSGTVIIRVKV